jgi:RNA polymerase sigma-70 factor (ECF subfamily)
MRGSDCVAQANEAELVRRAQAGDTGAFATLVAEHQGFVYNLAWRTLGDLHEAENIAQEAFVRAWLALPRFRQQAQFRTWLYRIVINLCYNHLPRLRRDLAALSEAELIAAGVPDEALADLAAGVEADERRHFLHRQIEALPESYRLLITLRYQHELSYEEIAHVTSLPLGTVKTGLFRARTQLRQALRAFEEE